jgi:DNA polymerase III subunit epsilon
MTRKLIVVDVETTGLQDYHVPLEIAAVPIDGTPFYMAPYVDSVLRGAVDPDALSINRYFERRVYKHELSALDTTKKYLELHKLLLGNTFGGSNPRFDAAKISAAFTKTPDIGAKNAEPWHHRLADLATYAAGVLRIPPTELPRLEDVCTALGVKNKEPHSAMGDAVATAECFRLLMSKESK